MAGRWRAARQVKCSQTILPGLTIAAGVTPIFDLTIPDVLVDRRWSSRDEIAALGGGWRTRLLEALGPSQRHTAVVLPTSAEGVALFLAVGSLPAPIILLTPDPRTWRTDPPIPLGTPLVLPPSLAALEPEARLIGCVPLPLPEGGEASHDAALTPLQTPGVVMFTSGSTGLPRPVFRTIAGVLTAAMARLRALQIVSGEGILTGLPLGHGPGLGSLLASMTLGGTFGLLGPIDHRAALTMLARPEFSFWWETPHFADVLGRCTLAAPAAAPRACVIASPISRRVFAAFLDRFGVPLRQTYASNETGVVSVDAGPSSDVRPETVGRPLPGVEVVIGDTLREPCRRAETGRIWVKSPWQMHGYGFPPTLERPGAVGDWWPTKDVGSFDGDRLILAGRIDDCIRTRDSRLVNLAAVARSFQNAARVRDAVVLGLEGSAGTSIGAVIQGEAALTIDELRQELWSTMPSAWWPRQLVLVDAMPRLANGKPDRRRCHTLLNGAEPS